MDIRGQIELLHSCGELLEIDAEIDGRLELAALTALASRHAGPGLLFRKVTGTELCLATNLFGGARRMAMALGHENLTDFDARLRREMFAVAGGSSAARLGALMETVETTESPSARIARMPSMSILPQLRFWPKEERSFLTLAVLISRAPGESPQNYGLYRVGIHGERRLTLNLLPGSGGGQHLAQWRALGKSMPVAILLGADPALLMAAAAPLPADCAEDRFSGFVARRHFLFSPCQTVPLNAPTSGQILIEGWIDSESTVNEGPFGCFRGDYGGSNECPVVALSALSMVDEPLLPLTLAGPLPMEDCWFAKANLALIRARLAIDLPEICTIEMPLESAFHGVYFVSSSNPAAVAAELAGQMRGLDYLARLTTLVLLRAGDGTVTETNWRDLLQRLPAAQLWQAPGTDLVALIKRTTPQLQHDPQMLTNLLQRLKLQTSHFKREKG